MSEPLEEQLGWAQLRERMGALEQRLADGFSLGAQELTERLRTRTQQWAKQCADDTAEERLDVLSFSLSGELYAMGSEHVAHVLPLNHYTPLPNTPDYVLGIVNVRGRIVSVLDLRVLFELPIDHLSDRSFLLVLQSPEMEFGLLIDRVLDGSQISRDALQPGPANLLGVRANYLLGVTAEQCTVLDGARLLSDPNLRVLVEE
jgi:purine-binding chemotaxis protein CheW